MLNDHLVERLVIAIIDEARAFSHQKNEPFPRRRTLPAVQQVIHPVIPWLWRQAPMRSGTGTLACEKSGALDISARMRRNG